jgi:hypothetical protein
MSAERRVVWDRVLAALAGEGAVQAPVISVLEEAFGVEPAARAVEGAGVEPWTVAGALSSSQRVALAAAVVAEVWPDEVVITSASRSQVAAA